MNADLARPGYLADLVVLSGDLFAVAPRELRSAKELSREPVATHGREN